MNDFIPKQALAKDPTLYETITAGSTQSIIRIVLSRLPPLTSSSVIHDNGCGSGEVIGEMMAQSPPPGISIHATDIEEAYLEKLADKVRVHNWPVQVAEMDAAENSFADAGFDLAIANFMLFAIPEDGLPALRHMRRTLKPGGKAIATTWAKLPHVEPIRAAHDATRGADDQSLREMPSHWWRGDFLAGQAIKAGFEESKVVLQEAVAYIKVDDLNVLANVMWSWMGAPTTGWKQRDEEMWDKAIQVILKEWQTTEGMEKLEEGKMRLKLVANVVIATK